jgi:hypothetical protein
MKLYFLSFISFTFLYMHRTVCSITRTIRLVFNLIYDLQEFLVGTVKLEKRRNVHGGCKATTKVHLY